LRAARSRLGDGENVDHKKNALTHLSDAFFMLLVQTIVIVSVPLFAIRDAAARRPAPRASTRSELRDAPFYARR
jgi:hypothetical protein